MKKVKELLKLITKLFPVDEYGKDHSIQYIDGKLFLVLAHEHYDIEYCLEPDADYPENEEITLDMDAANIAKIIKSRHDDFEKDK